MFKNKKKYPNIGCGTAVGYCSVSRVYLEEESGSIISCNVLGIANHISESFFTL